MKTKQLLILFIVALITATNALAQQNVQKIDGLLKQYHEYGQFNGSVLVAEKGKIIYEKGFGLANMEWAVPNQPDTKFRIGSVTKQFTAALVLQLVEEGKVKLDGKITDYLPDYRKDTGSASFQAAPKEDRNASCLPFSLNLCSCVVESGGRMPPRQPPGWRRYDF